MRRDEVGLLLHQAFTEVGAVDDGLLRVGVLPLRAHDVLETRLWDRLAEVFLRLWIERSKRDDVVDVGQHLRGLGLVLQLGLEVGEGSG